MMMAVNAVGLTALAVALSAPTLAYAVPVAPLAPPPCQQFGFAGFTGITFPTQQQRFSFNATGPRVDATATSPINASQGHITGGIDQNGHVDLTLTTAQANNNDDFHFLGDVGGDGIARGTVDDGSGNSASWATDAPLKCVTQAAPTNAVTADVQQSPFGVKINVKNTSAVDGRCTYDARPTNDPLLPPVHRDFNLNPNDATTLDFLAPPPGSTYHFVISCHGPHDEIGHVEQDVTGGL